MNELEGAKKESFLLFRLGTENYAVHLLAVREVTEFLPIKRVPNTVKSFLGVCNLRGQIIGVLDLCDRFEIQKSESSQSVLIVFDAGVGCMAVLVDEISSVTEIQMSDVEFQPNIVCSMPSNFIHGIARTGDKLVTIIKLQEILSHEEIVLTRNEVVA
jgi:purine-binding chemotaxis protein CheW